MQIIPRGSKKWLVRVYVGSEMRDGKRVKKYTARTIEGTYKQAEKAAASMTSEVSEGTFIPPTKQTLRQYVEWWLAEVVPAEREQSTQRSYADRVGPFLGHHVGHLKLDKVTTPALQKALNELAAERQWSKRTARYTKTVLSVAFNHAVRIGLLRSNPMSAVVLPKCTQGGDESTQGGHEEMKVWTQAEVQSFLARTDDTEHALWTVLLNTGMRPGEALGLKWTDLSGNNLTIRRAVKQGSTQGTWVIGVPKTKRSKRTIPLPTSTVALLKRHKLARQQESVEYVFGDAQGFRNPREVSAAWERSVAEAGLPRITLYGCRHTHATLLLSMNIPVKVVSERLGHSNIGITMDTYQHVLPHMQEEVAAKLNAAFG